MDSNDKKRFEIKEESGQAGGAGSLSIARHVQFQAFVRAVQGHSMKAAPVPCCRDWPRRSMGSSRSLVCRLWRMRAFFTVLAQEMLTCPAQNGSIQVVGL